MPAKMTSRFRLEKPEDGDSWRLIAERPGRDLEPNETEQAEIELDSVVGIGFELSTDQALADWAHGFITIVSKRTESGERATYKQVI